MLALNIVLFIVTFAAMEFVAWFAHKYIMHGFLWNIHKDHHVRDEDRFLEHNDLFVLIFATPAIILFYFGYDNGFADPRTWIGMAITLYGLCYMFVHDIFIHQRVKALTRTDNTYLKAIRRAHKVHHKHLGKEDGECFGMLWAPPKYFAEARKSRQKA